jgi:hypothetical protein
MEGVILVTVKMIVGLPSNSFIRRDIEGTEGQQAAVLPQFQHARHPQ